MKVFSCQALLVATAALSAQAAADYIVTPGDTTPVMNQKHVQYIKQWTLTAGDDDDSIDAIYLRLAGNVFVSYVSDLPRDVLGYVNVSGSSEAVINGVVVGEDAKEAREFGEMGTVNDVYDVFADRSVSPFGVGLLNIHLRNTVTSGHLLTEIFLAVPDAVSEISSELSAKVVIEDGVLLRKSKRSTQSIEAGGNSTVYVSAPDTDISVHTLNLETSGNGSIIYNVGDLSVWADMDLETQDLSSINLLSSSVETTHLDLDAATKTSRICIAAEKVNADESDISGKRRISLPNSSEKYGAKGKFACEESQPPVRTAARIVGVASVNPFLDDDYETLDDDLDDDRHDREDYLDDRNDREDLLDDRNRL